MKKVASADTSNIPFLIDLDPGAGDIVSYLIPLRF